jgi:hypothetical protein
MTHWENIWSFSTAQFRVDYDVAEDTDLDLSCDEDGSVRAGLESGKYVAFRARIAVIDNDGDIIGADYLGGCIYESAEAFIDHRANGRHGSYFYDMVRSAIREARKNLCAPRPYIRCSAVESR